MLGKSMELSASRGSIDVSGRREHRDFHYKVWRGEP
jgi:hypothetical protein